jgi:hypothetical protein
MFLNKSGILESYAFNFCFTNSNYVGPGNQTPVAKNEN